jgi:hypothetical protein
MHYLESTISAEIPEMTEMI